jgi:PST family polysaccharide transporter
VAIVLALSGHGLWSLLAINMVVTVVSLAGLGWVGRRHLARPGGWRFDPALARDLARQGLPTGLAVTALAAIVTQFDDFLIGTFVDYATLGLYDRAFRIAHWPHLLLTMIVARVGFLAFVAVRDDPPRLTRAVGLALWTLSMLGPPIALVLFFAAPDIVGVLYGARWSASAGFLRVLTVYSLAWPYVSIGLWLAVALAHHRAALILTGAPALSLIAIGTPLTLSLGVSGTLIAVVATMLLAFALSCRYVFRQVQLDPRLTLAPPLVAIAVASAILLALTALGAWARLSSPGRIAGTAMVGPATYLLTLFALRREDMLAWTGYLRRAFGVDRTGA